MHIDISEESGWAGLNPAEISLDLGIAIKMLSNANTVDRNHLRMHFAPTGPLQDSDGVWLDE